MLWRSLLVVLGLLGLSVVIAAQPPDKPAGSAPAKPGDAAANKPADKPAPNPLNAFKGNSLSADEPSEKDQRDFAKMVRGQDDPAVNPIPPARRMELLDKVPRYLIYRLTRDELHGGLEKQVTHDLMEGTPAGTMDGIYKMFPTNPIFRAADDAEEQAKRNRQKIFMAELRAASTPFLREVFKNRLYIARLNAAIVLERFAQFNQEEVADDMTAILEDPNEHDGIKHWAIKGLGTVFANSANKPKDPKRLERGALAVYKWLDEHTKIPPTLLADLSEPEQDAIRLIRKGAIQTLGAYRRPVIVEDAKTSRREGPVAELLVKIMGNTQNAIAPDAGWPEREEAAVALCNLQSKQSPGYHADFVAAQIARFIAALGAEANRDAGRSTQPAQRWQRYAGHLREGTDTLAADLKGTPSGAYFGKLMDRINPVLENLFDERKFQSAVGDLNEAVNNSPPKGSDVFGSPMEKK